MAIFVKTIRKNILEHVAHGLHIAPLVLLALLDFSRQSARIYAVQLHSEAPISLPKKNIAREPSSENSTVHFNSCHDLVTVDTLTSDTVTSHNSLSERELSKSITHHSAETSIENRAIEILTAAQTLILMNTHLTESDDSHRFFNPVESGFKISEGLVSSTLAHHLSSEIYRATALASEFLNSGISETAPTLEQMNTQVATHFAAQLTMQSIREQSQMFKIWRRLATGASADITQNQESFKRLKESQLETRTQLERVRTVLANLTRLSKNLSSSIENLKIESEATRRAQARISTTATQSVPIADVKINQKINMALNKMTDEAQLLVLRLQNMVSSLEHSLSSYSDLEQILEQQLQQELPGLLNASRAKIELYQLDSLVKDVSQDPKKRLFSKPVLPQQLHVKHLVTGNYSFEIEIWTPDAKFAELNNSLSYKSARVFNGQIFQDVEVVASARITSAEGLADWYLIQSRESDFMFSIEPSEFVLDDKQYAKLVAPPRSLFGIRQKPVRPKAVWIKASDDPNIIWNFKE